LNPKDIFQAKNFFLVKGLPYTQKGSVARDFSAQVSLTNNKEKYRKSWTFSKNVSFLHLMMQQNS